MMQRRLYVAILIIVVVLILVIVAVTEVQSPSGETPDQVTATYNILTGTIDPSPTQPAATPTSP
ncbi:MAG: hypothetical protein H6672_19860 [Anaerolineaceae bacterium]|nr:hypothetical protein [Anaerolineaceae bacterium]